jgi:hypothetical protein
MDGRALLIDAEGEVIYQHAPDESRISVLLGAAISEDRRWIALVSGIDPQTLTIVEHRAGQFVPVSTRQLDSDFRREVQVRFDPGDQFLFYEVAGGLGVLDVRKKGGARLLSSGVLESIDSSPEFTAAAFRLAEGSRLLVFRSLDTLLLSRELDAERLYVKTMGNSLILGYDGVLLRADLVEN